MKCLARVPTDPDISYCAHEQSVKSAIRDAGKFTMLVRIPYLILPSGRWLRTRLASLPSLISSVSSSINIRLNLLFWYLDKAGIGPPNTNCECLWDLCRIYLGKWSVCMAATTFPTTLSLIEIVNTKKWHQPAFYHSVICKNSHLFPFSFELSSETPTYRVTDRGNLSGDVGSYNTQSVPKVVWMQSSSLMSSCGLSRLAFINAVQFHMAGG